MSDTNAFVGVAYHWAGGLAAASFYIPYKGIKRWSWETYWLAGGFFSWIVAPILMAWLLVPDLLQILSESPRRSVLTAFCFGMVWGIGGLTFGLTMRYLGIALGCAVALGMCAMFGTLVPPLIHGQLGAMLMDRAGQVTLFGVGVCLIGIIISGLAGTSKESELTQTQKMQSSSEFQFFKGIIVALIAGILSAAMAFALDAAAPIGLIADKHLRADGRLDVWQGLPGLICVLLGGFVTNFAWCVLLNVRNRTAYQYVSFSSRDVTELAASQAVDPFDMNSLQTETIVHHPVRSSVPLPLNYVLAALAGFTWYFQFFFYTMGSTKMGQFGFSSWTLHMASIIIFSTMWGIVLKEWQGTSRRTHFRIALGLLVLIASTVIVGYGNYLKGKS